MINEEILRRTNEDRELIVTIKRRKTAYVGHTIVVECELEGKKKLIVSRRGYIT